MNNIDETIRNASKTHAKVDEELYGIFRRHYTGGDDSNIDAARMSGIELACHMSVALCNIFLAIRRPEERRTYRAVCDLTFGLNTNGFWVANAGVIMPVVHAALNTYRDGVELTLDTYNKGEYGVNDALATASRLAPLEIFPLIAYLIGGPPLMLATSIPLKQDLAPYFAR